MEPDGYLTRKWKLGVRNWNFPPRDDKMHVLTNDLLCILK